MAEFGGTLITGQLPGCNEVRGEQHRVHLEQ